jgi:hypothetical protein
MKWSGRDVLGFYVIKSATALHIVPVDACVEIERWLEAVYE